MSSNPDSPNHDPMDVDDKTKNALDIPDTQQASVPEASTSDEKQKSNEDFQSKNDSEEREILEYYNLRNIDKSPEEINQQNISEVNRIYHCQGGSVADIWGTDPLEYSDEKSRNRIYKCLMMMVHPNKHVKNGPEIQKYAEEATKILSNTANVIEQKQWEKLREHNSSHNSSEDAAKGGPEYLRFYNNVPFITALITLMNNADNQAAIDKLQETNLSIQKENAKSNAGKQGYSQIRGTFRIDPLREMYRRAQKVYKELGDSRKEPNAAQEKELVDVFNESRDYCKELGLPRSFSLPSPSYKFNPKTWWTKKYKNEHGNNDGMMSTEEFQQAANIQKPTQEGSPTMEDSVEKNPARTEFVPHQIANPKKLTYDGRSMLASQKAGANGWLIIVQEEQGYRFRSGAECGGPNYIKDVVENLPRLSAGDDKLLNREKGRLAQGGKSTFVETKGLVQHAGGTWLLTTWNVDGETEDRWTSRTTLSKCLKSAPMVDAMIEAHGGVLLATGARKTQWEALIEINSHQKLLLGAQTSSTAGNDASPSPDSQQMALIQALGALSLRKFKHPVFGLRV